MSYNPIRTLRDREFEIREESDEETLHLDEAAIHRKSVTLSEIGEDERRTKIFVRGNS
jgi:hypothetical protein